MYSQLKSWTNDVKMTNEESRSSSKRLRQPTLFERVVEGLINTIEDSSQVQYLKQIKDTLGKMKDAEQAN